LANYHFLALCAWDGKILFSNEPLDEMVMEHVLHKILQFVSTKQWKKNQLNMSMVTTRSKLVDFHALKMVNAN
jgi:hypothetical protein